MATCIVICEFALPVPTEEKFIKAAQRSAPKFRDLAARGLISKDYICGKQSVGGVYFWESREAAEAWFTEETIEQYTSNFGVRPTLTWFDSFLTVDNKAGETRINASRPAGA